MGIAADQDPAQVLADGGGDGRGSSVLIFAGNGGHEIRQWLAVGAMRERLMPRLLAYEPIPGCGTGVMVWSSNYGWRGSSVINVYDLNKLMRASIATLSWPRAVPSGPTDFRQRRFADEERAALRGWDIRWLLAMGRESVFAVCRMDGDPEGIWGQFVRVECEA